VKHEGYVFEQEPARTALARIEQTKYVPYEPRVSTTDTGRSSCLTEVLARESCRHKIRIPDGFQVPNVRYDARRREASPQNGRGPGIEFAEHN
jgi:hypothetical protein